MHFFCDAKSKISTIKNEAAKTATYLDSFQTHLQGNATLPSAAVSTYLWRDRCSTKGAPDSAPAPSDPAQVLSKRDLCRPVTGADGQGKSRALSSTWLCFSLIHSISPILQNPTHRCLKSSLQQSWTSPGRPWHWALQQNFTKSRGNGESAWS